ncbi:citrulline utilization hydrolase CtlX [Ascidiimonas sp. W6]|uniref:citrulline utilization hydrolase CtlX n=1 Tax=Ascidiimonas meishanensis TaxID=3128903 RepID=UPI0030ECA24C
MTQITNTILMVRPVNFRMNEQTAVNNYFQEDLDLKNKEINLKAQEEFDAFVSKLRSCGINVIVVDDRKESDTPDSIFPNNWISNHANGTVVMYPMFAENRRKERREDILDILEENGFQINHVVDYTSAEAEDIFLEGTGSLLLDRVNNKVYCALSSRADEGLVIEFCEDFECSPVIFTANQTVNGTRLPIYHTNVMMCLGENFCVICLASIDDKKERKSVIAHLKENGKEIIEISEKQMHNFAGNMLQLVNNENKRYIVMSEAAYKSLKPIQVNQLEKHGEILFSNLHTIETCGGGSARCMMAEVFLPKTKK